MVVLGKMVNGSRADAENLFTTVANIVAVYLSIANLFEVVAVYSHTQLLWQNLVSRGKVQVDCLPGLGVIVIVFSIP